MQTSMPAITTSPQPYARVAGVLYLVIIVFGLWSEVFVRGSLIVAGDATETAANILASEGLFRASFAANSVMALCDVALAVLLYVLLRPVNATLALTAAALRLIQTAVIAASLLNQYAALLLLSGAGHAAVFEPDQLYALVVLALDMHGHGYDLGLIFFGLSCLVLGFLVARSGYLPRALGWLVMAAGVVYLVGSYALFLFPAQADAVQPLYVVPVVSEVALCLWLLVRGVNVEAWRQRVALPA